MSAAASSETRQRLVEGRGCAGESAASRVVLGRKMERLSRFVALCVSLHNSESITVAERDLGARRGVGREGRRGRGAAADGVGAGDAAAAATERERGRVIGGIREQCAVQV